jgi:hypothetical protein
MLRRQKPAPQHDKLKFVNLVLLCNKTLHIGEGYKFVSVTRIIEANLLSL